MTGSYFHKKIILILALVAFLVSGFFPTNVIEAATNDATDQVFNIVGKQAGTPTPPKSQAQALQDLQKAAGLPVTNPVPASGSVVNTMTGKTQKSQAELVQAAKNAPPAKSQTSKNDEIYCFDFGGEGLTGARFSLTGCGAIVAFAILGVASWVLWLSAILFNATISYTLNMAGFLSDVPIVALGWTTFRDLANLFFVFIILYIAINTIVGNEGYGIKKLLGKVIVTAMLINFSLFFTQAMIDGSNIMALQFYHKIIQDSSDSAGADGGLNSLDGGISAAFVKGLGLQEVWGIGQEASKESGANSLDPNDASTQKLGLNSGNLLIVGLGGTVLVLITAFVFFAATLMFLLRTVTLVFLMILSPLAFMGSVLPALGDVTKKWWSKLFNNLLFAPAYMTLLYLVISMITKGGFTGVRGGGSFYQLFSGNDNMIGAAMTFVVLNALMVGCLLIASSFGVAGSKWAESTGMGLATNLGMKFSGANLGMGIARSGLGVAGGAITSFAKPLASSNFGRVIGGAALLRGGQALKDVKVGGKSYKDAIKAKEDQISKEYEAIKETDTNIVQRRWESTQSFDARKAKADALETKNQNRADARIGVTTDQRTGKVSKKGFGIPSILGGTAARHNAQKKLSKGREGDVDKSIKKPFEKAVQEARENLKGALYDQKQNPGNLAFTTAVATAQGNLRTAQSNLKRLFDGGPAPTPTP